MRTYPIRPEPRPLWRQLLSLAGYAALALTIVALIVLTMAAYAPEWGAK